MNSKRSFVKKRKEIFKRKKEKKGSLNLFNEQWFFGSILKFYFHFKEITFLLFNFFLNLWSIYIVWRWRFLTTSLFIKVIKSSKKTKAHIVKNKCEREKIEKEKKKKKKKSNKTKWKWTIKQNKILNHFLQLTQLNRIFQNISKENKRK